MNTEWCIYIAESEGEEWIGRNRERDREGWGRVSYRALLFYARTAQHSTEGALGASCSWLLISSHECREGVHYSHYWPAQICNASRLLIYLIATMYLQSVRISYSSSSLLISPPSSYLSPYFLYPSAALIGDNILYFGGGANNSNGVSVLKIGASTYGKCELYGIHITEYYSRRILLFTIFVSCVFFIYLFTVYNTSGTPYLTHFSILLNFHWFVVIIFPFFVRSMRFSHR
jgi:hypothetical protein